jgi:hypothetical protein
MSPVKKLFLALVLMLLGPFIPMLRVYLFHEGVPIECVVTSTFAAFWLALVFLPVAGITARLIDWRPRKVQLRWDMALFALFMILSLYVGLTVRVVE